MDLLVVAIVFIGGWCSLCLCSTTDSVAFIRGQCLFEGNIYSRKCSSSLADAEMILEMGVEFIVLGPGMYTYMYM